MFNATWALPRTLLLALAAASCVSALHLYLDAGETRCFIEELPNETVVEGHYRALEWNEKDQVYGINSELGILTEITEMDTGHVVTSTRGPADSRWTFTSHDSGDHSICMSTNYSSSWFGPTAHIRLYLDIVVGNTRPDIEHDRGHISELASKIRDLNLKLEDIRREQQYQRERESDFRDLSELLNGRAVWYSLAQIAVLVATCAWQLRHLRNFFEDKRNH